MEILFIIIGLLGLVAYKDKVLGAAWEAIGYVYVKIDDLFDAILK